MTPMRKTILTGMAIGALWAVVLVWIGVSLVNLPIFSFTWLLAAAFLPGGLVLAVMIGRLAGRRFFDTTLTDGAPPPPGSAGEIDQRAIRNTVEQLVLALAIWPATGHFLATDGPGVVICLGLNFAVARLVFWLGYRVMILRAVGFAATFYPTLAAVIWAGLFWLVN